MIIEKEKNREVIIFFYMATKELKYTGYLYLLNRIGYWLVINDKKITHPNEVTIQGKTKKYETIIETIKNNGKKYGKDEFVGRLMEYHITKSDVLPAYVMGSGEVNQYSRASYTDMVKRVTKFRKDNGRNPNSVKAEYVKVEKSSTSSASSSSSKKKKSVTKKNNTKKKTTTGKKTECKSPYKALPYDNKTGCDHMGQNTGYWCGPSMLQKMFKELGITGIKQSDLARVAGTTTVGTDHYGLETAVAWVSKKKGVKLSCKWYYFSDLSWKKLGAIMCNKKQSFGCHIKYRDKWGHYEKPLSIYTDTNTVKVINSLGDKCTSSCYCGYIESRSFSTHKRYIDGVSQKSILVITRE